MDKASRLGSGIAKIGLIKRDMTKLSSGHEPAVVWRDEAVALWRQNQPTPDGYEPHQRIVKERLPKCPHCGCTVLHERKGVATPATESWLKSGKRSCAICQSPLWQQARDKGSKPKSGYKYPTKNPRYRLDEYLKRIYPDRVYLLIWDEVHEAQHGDTGNGEAFGRLAGLARKKLAMTGTPFNGRSSSLFNLEYHLNPRVRQRYGWGGASRLGRKARGCGAYQTIIDDDSKQRGRAESRWVADMGVREMVVEERPSYDNETGAFTGTSTYERPYEEAPGISPMLVAEVLDHAIFFSLGDLGKWLPQFEEIALPVELDPDVYAEYDRTRQRLKDYLIQRRWEGDTTFRGAYLQWAMGWPNAAHRPHDVIHNLKHPITGEKLPHVVASIPSFGEDRIFAKEQALIDLLNAELAEKRPCVIYLRQTSTRDIQPRIESLIRQHVPEARTFILKNTVDAERREAVIEAEIAKGTNIVICNPELVKTGLDLVFAPTLIFFELVFNLSTLMQAAARSYRLNQTHTHCKVYYFYAEGTMEQTAVQLMSRKQRAAKLLTGDIGLTGLDALTEGEGGFEEALMAALGHDEGLVNPSEMFKTNATATEIDAEDAAYWNVEVEAAVEPQPEPIAIEDPLIALAAELGATVREIAAETVEQVQAQVSVDVDRSDAALLHSIGNYLDDIHLITDTRKRAQLQARLLTALTDGVQRDDGTYRVLGICDPEFSQYAVHEDTITRWVRGWLKEHRFVFAGCEDEAAAQIVRLAKQALGLSLVRNSVSRAPKAQSKPTQRKVNPAAVPETTSPAAMEPPYETALVQLALF